MRVAAITKFKQGDLFRTLRELGWTQSELARRAGLSPSEIGAIINMRKRPSPERAQKIAFALGEAGKLVDLDQLWPTEFKGTEKTMEFVQYKDVPAERLEAPPAVPLLQMREDIKVALTGLSKKQKFVLDQVYIKGRILEEVAVKLGITRQQVLNIRDRALSRARHRLYVRDKREEDSEKWYAGAVDVAREKKRLERLASRKSRMKRGQDPRKTTLPDPKPTAPSPVVCEPPDVQPPEEEVHVTSR